MMGGIMQQIFVIKTLTYEACIRLCLKNSSIPEANAFLKDECSILRAAFCLDQFLLQPEEDLRNKETTSDHGVFEKPTKACSFSHMSEITAYDLVLEAAMKAQNFNQKNLRLHGQWRWLVTTFASYYGVSDAYTKLRYLSYVMDVSTPTADCLGMIVDLFSPVKIKPEDTLSSLEKRMLVSLSDQIKGTIALVFENYKSPDYESSLSRNTSIKFALKLYYFLHDMESLETKMQLCNYFQTAVQKILSRYLTETDEYVSRSGRKSTVDQSSFTSGYRKMKMLVINIRNEIASDVEMHDKGVLPKFLDLPNLSTALYTLHLSNRMRTFLAARPPVSLSPPVTDLIITTCDFQKDLLDWNISPVNDGVDAKSLFDMYITKRINDKRLEWLESCNLYKLRLRSGKQQDAPVFADDMFTQFKETSDEFRMIISHLPEYYFLIDKVISDTKGVWNKILENHTRPENTYWTKLKNVRNRLHSAKVR